MWWKIRTFIFNWDLQGCRWPLVPFEFPLSQKSNWQFSFCRNFCCSLELHFNFWLIFPTTDTERLNKYLDFIAQSYFILREIPVLKILILTNNTIDSYLSVYHITKHSYQQFLKARQILPRFSLVLPLKTSGLCCVTRIVIGNNIFISSPAQVWSTEANSKQTHLLQAERFWCLVGLF